MINREHELPVARQCRALKLARSSVYYQARGISEADLRLMRRIDELHLQYPFAGSRMLRDLLEREGNKAGRRHVRSLMTRLNIHAIYRKPRTSQPQPGHKIYPYRLRGLKIDRPNQVWAADITYIPMQKGFVYLFAVMDWYSRKVLAWRLSNTLSTDFCCEALQEAFSRYGLPQIFNTDQGVQFTSEPFTALLKEKGIAISMDGRGCWRDNVFVERLWKSLKYEEVYLHAYESVGQAKQGIARYFDFYNRTRPHTTLDKFTPDEVYSGKALPQTRAA